MFAVAIRIQYMFFVLLVFVYVCFICCVTHVEWGQKIVAKRGAKKQKKLKKKYFQYHITFLFLNFFQLSFHIKHVFTIIIATIFSSCGGSIATANPHASRDRSRSSKFSTFLGN